MKRILAIALGVLTAIGGFVDIGDLVASSQAGARFGSDRRHGSPSVSGPAVRIIGNAGRGGRGLAAIVAMTDQSR